MTARTSDTAEQFVRLSAPRLFSQKTTSQYPQLTRAQKLSP